MGYFPQQHDDYNKLHKFYPGSRRRRVLPVDECAGVWPGCRPTGAWSSVPRPMPVGLHDLRREGRFTTTRCLDCGKVRWPPRTLCPACVRDDMGYVDMPKYGEVCAYTVQYAGVPPVYEAPLGYALIDTKAEKVEKGLIF